jgi:iron-sulfur cluster repair protein YtfE (RIC family)
MTEGEKTRLVAWGNELRSVHERLREALRVTRESGRTAEPDLLLLCHGFCTALTGHHRGEDRELFPAIAAAHPELRETLRKLQQDHVLIGELVTALEAATEPADIDRHLDGLAAIMESHFQYEERQLLAILDKLSLSADPQEVLGPL